jgi:hypothetical protein
MQIIMMVTQNKRNETFGDIFVEMNQVKHKWFPNVMYRIRESEFQLNLFNDRKLLTKQNYTKNRV